MIAECLEYLATPCPRPLRGMGYLRELLGIKARAWRCWRAWQPHLERSKAVIRRAIGECGPRRKAVILGSGMLYDVPVAELAAAFREVLLVDIVHPLKSWLPAWRVRNLRPLTADMTGVAEAVFRLAETPAAPLPVSEPRLFLDDDEVDLVVSLNLLSQLPYVPAQFLEHKTKLPAEAVQEFGRHLVQAHLDYLQRFRCPVALISDVEKLTLDVRGQVVATASALRGVEFPYPGEEWVWELAPRPEIDPEHSYFRRVVGVVNVRRIHYPEGRNIHRIDRA